MSESSQHRPRIGEILVSKRLLSEGQRATVLRAQRERQGSRFGTIAIEQGFLPKLELLKALSEQQGVPAIDLTQLVIPIHHLKYIGYELAKKHELLPIILKEDQMVLAMASPGADRIIEQLEYITGRKVFSYVTGHAELVESIEEVYEARRVGKAFFIGRNAPDDYLASMGLSRQSTEASTPQEVETEAERVTVLPEAAAVVDEATSISVIEEDWVGDEPTTMSSVAEVKSAATHILVVDDDADIRRMMLSSLKAEGLSAKEAASGAAALASVKAEVPSLVVLDAMMPGLHGLDVCKRLKASPATANVPVLLVSAVYTGWRAEADLKTSYDVEGYMEKPFSLKTFVAKVKEMLADSSPRQEDSFISHSPEAVRALQEGIEIYRGGDIAAALASLEAGLEHDGACFHIHLQLGLLYGRQNRVFEAISAMEQAVSIRHWDFSALRNLAILYQRAGFMHKATEAWERALAHSPDDATRAGIKEHLMSLL